MSPRPPGEGCRCVHASGKQDPPALCRGNGLVSALLHAGGGDSDLTVTWVEIDPGASQASHSHDPERVYAATGRGNSVSCDVCRYLTASGWREADSITRDTVRRLAAAGRGRSRPATPFTPRPTATTGSRTPETHPAPGVRLRGDAGVSTRGGRGVLRRPILTAVTVSRCDRTASCGRYRDDSQQSL